MRILYYSSHPTLSLKAQTGTGTHMREMINAMRELDHEVHPVIMADILNAPASRPAQASSRGLKPLAKKMIPGLIWRSLKEVNLLRFDTRAGQILRQEIDKFKPDLVYERAAYMQVEGLKAIKEKKCLHYMEINAPFIDEVRQFEGAPTLLKNMARHSEYLQTNSPDKVYVVSGALKKYYMKYAGDKDKIEVMPNCVNSGKAISDQLLKYSLKFKLGLRGKFVIGFVGSIFPYHGVDLLIKAFASVALSKPDSVLLIVGDGQTIPELRSLSRQLGIENKVIFTGSIAHDEVFTYIDLMDITVMVKSNWYGSPVKIFEYGAMRKPIIAPFTSPVMDVMHTGVDALLTPPDEQSVCNAINSLISDKSLGNRLADTFHYKVMQHHTWKGAAETILKHAV
jgi:glycosyltransferase involved in cell wall biosynthesis